MTKEGVGKSVKSVKSVGKIKIKNKNERIDWRNSCNDAACRVWWAADER
jgi:hypothetical protein